MLSLLLLQHALAPGVIDAHARSRLPASRGTDNPASRPYLKIAALASPLRFNSPPPPPDLTSKPTAGAPPQPLEASPDAVAAISSAAAPLLPSIPSLATSAQPTTTPVSPATSTSAEPATPAPTAILPDDTRPPIRAEDFLPFFQFPTTGGDVSVVVPASAARVPTPGQLPPSSASYQQK